MAATHIGEKSRELSATNPWWRSATGWERSDPDLTAARDSGLAYRPEVLAGLQRGGLYILRGPRRVGKTVSTKQAVAALIASGVPPLAVIRVAADGWSAADLRTVVHNVALPPAPPGSVRYWFFDEVTGVTGDWAAQIKWLRDNDPDFAAAAVVLTGSNASALSAAAGALAGRRGRVDDVDRTLMPMGFRAFARTWIEAVDEFPRVTPEELHDRETVNAYLQVLPWLNDLVRLWEVYLGYGGFPVAVAAAKAGEPVPRWFTQALFDVVHRDAFVAGSLDGAQTTALLRRLWQSLATPLNRSAVAEDVGLSTPTVARHVEYLRDAYLVWRCPQLDREWVGREKAMEKLYPVDPLVARLPYLRGPSSDDLDPTVLAEAQVGNCLRRAALARVGAPGADSTLFHVRTPARKEVDFVGPGLGRVAVEGKYTDSGRWRGESRTVEASGYRGVLATRSVLDVSAGADGAWAVPAALLAVLVDT